MPLCPNCLARIGLICLGLACAREAAAGVFKCVDKSGNTVYQDHICVSTDTRQSEIDVPAASNESDPSLAAVYVYSVSGTIDRALEFCEVHDPGNVGVLRAARNAWRYRHAALLAKSKAILDQRMSKTSQSALDQSVETASRRALGQVGQGSKDGKTRWCANFPTLLQLPTLNLLDHKVLVNTLNGNGGARK